MSDGNQNESGQEKKIFVDEDWKSQVQAEKEAAQKSDESPAEGEATSEQQTPEDEGGGQPKDVPLPPPSLLSLVSGLATQAMVSMGAFPNPATGKPTMMLHQAKHLVDTVELLQEKTQGNRTEEESKTIEGVLHELRMLYVAAQRQAGEEKPE
jgi:hypothetical protein